MGRVVKRLGWVKIPDVRTERERPLEIHYSARGKKRCTWAGIAIWFYAASRLMIMPIQTSSHLQTKPEEWSSSSSSRRGVFMWASKVWTMGDSLDSALSEDNPLSRHHHHHHYYQNHDDCILIRMAGWALPLHLPVPLTAYHCNVQVDVIMVIIIVIMSIIIIWILLIIVIIVISIIIIALQTWYLSICLH